MLLSAAVMACLEGGAAHSSEVLRALSDDLGAVVVSDNRVEPANHKAFVAAEVARWIAEGRA